MIRSAIILALIFGISFISKGASVTDFTSVNSDKHEDSTSTGIKSKPEAAKLKSNDTENDYWKNFKPEQNTSFKSILEKNKIITVKQNPFNFQELYLGSSNSPGFFDFISNYEGIDERELIDNAMAWEEMKLSLKNINTAWNRLDAWVTISFVKYMEDTNLSVINLQEIDPEAVQGNLKGLDAPQVKDSRLSASLNNLIHEDLLNKESSNLLYNIFSFHYLWEMLSDYAVPILIIAILWISIKILIIFLKPKASQGKKISKNRSIDGFIDL
ncbi:MAG: hypothetical protein ACXWTW_02865 [Methylobacter sp.]